MFNVRHVARGCSFEGLCCVVFGIACVIVCWSTSAAWLHAFLEDTWSMFGHPILEKLIVAVIVFLFGCMVKKPIQKRLRRMEFEYSQRQFESAIRHLGLSFEGYSILRSLNINTQSDIINASAPAIEHLRLNMRAPSPLVRQALSDWMKDLRDPQHTSLEDILQLEEQEKWGSCPYIMFRSRTRSALSALLLLLCVAGLAYHWKGASATTDTYLQIRKTQCLSKSPGFYRNYSVKSQVDCKRQCTMNISCGGYSFYDEPEMDHPVCELWGFCIRREAPAPSYDSFMKDANLPRYEMAHKDAWIDVEFACSCSRKNGCLRQPDNYSSEVCSERCSADKHCKIFQYDFSRTICETMPTCKGLYHIPNLSAFSQSYRIWHVA